MSEQNPEILRVSLDDLETVTPTTDPGAPGPALEDLGSTAVAGSTKSYGNINTVSDIQLAPAEKGSIFLRAWLYLGIAGLIGALLGWAIAEPGFVDGDGHRWGNIWLLPLIVTLLCVAFAVAESIVERSARKAAIRAGLALPLGIVLGFIFDFIANIFYSIGMGICAQAGVQTYRNPAVWITRGLAWAIFGVAGGVVYGIIGRSMKKAGYGALGGAIGAAIGGIIFDPISFATHGGAASRAIGFALFGLATGLAIGLVESALKDRWLYVTAGPLAGKQFILYKPQTTVGSLQTADIYLFKDAEILPQHATLLQKGDRLQIIPEGPVYLGGQPVRTARILETGAILQIGRYSFRYQERPRS